MEISSSVELIKKLRTPDMEISSINSSELDSPEKFKQKRNIKN